MGILGSLRIVPYDGRRMMEEGRNRRKNAKFLQFSKILLKFAAEIDI
jgi:hypothetical protein